MKAITTSILLLFCILISPSAYASCEATENSVAIFADTGFKGNCATLEIGSYNESKLLKIGNDKLSSIQVGKNVKALVCEHSFRGSTSIYGEAKADIDALISDKARSSLGRCLHIYNPGRYTMDSSRVADNSVSSIYVSTYDFKTEKNQYKKSSPCYPGDNSSRIAIFKDQDFRGECKILNMADYNSSGQFGKQFGDRISSIMLGQNSKVYVDVYEHADSKGRSNKFFRSVKNLTYTEVGNDSISAINIRLCSDTFYWKCKARNKSLVPTTPMIMQSQSQKLSKVIETRDGVPAVPKEPSSTKALTGMLAQNGVFAVNSSKKQNDIPSRRGIASPVQVIPDRPTPAPPHLSNAVRAVPAACAGVSQKCTKDTTYDKTIGGTIYSCYDCKQALCKDGGTGGLAGTKTTSVCTEKATTFTPLTDDDLANDAPDVLAPENDPPEAPGIMTLPGNVLSEGVIVQTSKCSANSARLCANNGATCDVLGNNSDAPSADVCRWAYANSAAACNGTVGIWTTPNSRYAKNHPNAVAAGSKGVCITEVANIRKKSAN